MTYLEKILRALYWLPILFGGIVGIALTEPKFFKIGIISAAGLGIFIVLVLLQAILERRALARSRSEQTLIVDKRAASGDERPRAD